MSPTLQRELPTRTVPPETPRRPEVAPSALAGPFLRRLLGDSSATPQRLLSDSRWPLRACCCGLLLAVAAGQCLFPRSCVTSPSIRIFGSHVCVCPSRSCRDNGARGSGNSRCVVHSDRILSASSPVLNAIVSRNGILSVTSVP